MLLITYRNMENKIIEMNRFYNEEFIVTYSDMFGFA